MNLIMIDILNSWRICDILYVHDHPAYHRLASHGAQWQEISTFRVWFVSLISDSSVRWI